ncbi:MAG: response regulator [Chitinivibrionales bacterium]|nr:response regulator [Chitinivibrionales bacterium]MBD3359036.1 response regulator [Chitinivibrionales bacterium]
MGKRTVVIVDDSQFLIKQIVNFFEKELGFEVMATGTDGNAAVELYRKNKPDLITLDITMPNKDGMQAMQEILTEFPDARVMMISAVRGDAMLECMNMGAKGYVEKPLKFSDADFVSDFKTTVEEVFGEAEAAGDAA